MGAPTLREELATLTLGQHSEAYLLRAVSFAERAERRVSVRFSLVGTTWTATLLLGAAVPVAEALDAPSFVGPLLGFGVVISQALQRLLARITRSSRLEWLARRIRTEFRQSLVGMDACVDPGERIDALVMRIEEAYAEYNQQATAANSSTFSD